MSLQTRPFEVRAGYAPQTCLLIEALKVGNVGDVMTDKELQEICGVGTAPMQKGYSFLQSAIRFCERMGVFWKRIKGTEGIKCLDSVEKMHLCDSDRRHMSKVARRSIRRLGSIERKELTAGNQKRYDVQVAQHGAMALFADTRTEQKIIAAAEKQAIDRAQVIALFADSRDSTRPDVT
jgi:hypothetical protein